MADFGSLITAMVTPFDENLKINWGVLEDLVRDLVEEQKTESIIVSGTTGESPTLSREEKLDLFREVRRLAPPECKVIAGTGTNNGAEVLDLSKRAEDCGVDGLMIVTPYYNKPPQDALIAHYHSIAASVSLPIMIYNVPGRTGCDIDREALQELSSVSNIVALKEASGDLNKISWLKKEAGDNLKIYSGNDDQTLPLLALGGEGVVSVASHVTGRKIREMIKNFKQGDHEKALKLHHEMYPIFKVMFLVTNPIPVKASVQMRGIDVGGVRPPLVPLKEAERKRISDVLQENGIL